VMHQIHHSAEVRHRDKNFSVTLGLFDWIFGTMYIPEKGEVYRWGLNEEELGDKNPHLRLKDFYLEPFQRMWMSLKQATCIRALRLLFTKSRLHRASLLPLASRGDHRVQWGKHGSRCDHSEARAVRREFIIRSER